QARPSPDRLLHRETPTIERVAHLDAEQPLAERRPPAPSPRPDEVQGRHRHGEDRSDGICAEIRIPIARFAEAGGARHGTRQPYRVEDRADGREEDTEDHNIDEPGDPTCACARKDETRGDL